MEKNFNNIYLDTIEKIMNNGYSVTAKNSFSIGSNRDYFELPNYFFSIANPNYRLIDPKIGIFNIYKAIGRFLWLMRGSNLLSEIDYYDNNIKNFSDDGITIPGSSFGNRIFNSNGIDQFQNVINILSKDNSSRRAAVSVYQPYDNDRQSKDIPCLFGLFFNIRQNKLCTTILMRSNNAFRLLPYNVFELSLLAEIISCELNVEAGAIHYQAVSMHIYNDDKNDCLEIINNKFDSSTSFFDPKLSPKKPQLINLSFLNELERTIRLNNSPSLMRNFEKNKEVYFERLGEKWFQFYLILLDFHCIKSNELNNRKAINTLIREPYKSYLWQ